MVTFKISATLVSPVPSQQTSQYSSICLKILYISEEFYIYSEASCGYLTIGRVPTFFHTVRYQFKHYMLYIMLDIFWDQDTLSSWLFCKVEKWVPWYHSHSSSKCHSKLIWNAMEAKKKKKASFHGSTVWTAGMDMLSIYAWKRLTKQWDSDKVQGLIA